MFGKKKKKAALDLSALTAQVAELSSQVTNMAKPAAGKAKPAARKVAQSARGASGDLVHRASDATPSIEQIIAAVTAVAAPTIKAARSKAGPAVESAVGSARSHASDAARELEPYVDSVRGHVREELVPQVRDAFAAGYAASAPYREEAARRGTATVAALKGELEVKPPKRHVGRNVLILSGFAGLVFVAYKYLTGESSTSGWQTPVSAPAPSTANTTTGAHSTAAGADSVAKPADEKPLGDAEVAEDAADATLPTEGSDADRA